MKLSDRMKYPHPVLSEFSSDYVTGEFRCAFIQQMTPEGELKLEADLELMSKELRDLVESQRAAVGYFVVCRRTYFNTLQGAPLGKSSKFFDAAMLFGTVIVRPVIWTLVAVEKFSSALINREYGSSVNLPKASVVALGPEFRFSMDRKKFKPFESIFELAENATVDAGTINVDPMQERIVISAEPKTYKDLAGMRNMPAGRDILLNTVYMPAIMDVIALLQSGENLSSKAWYRVFKAKCDDLAIDPAARNQSPLALSQKLLRAPLKKAISVVGTLS